MRATSVQPRRCCMPVGQGAIAARPRTRLRGRRGRCQQRRQALKRGTVLRDDRAGAGVADNVLHLLRRAARAAHRVRAARRHHALIRHQPARAVLAEQRHLHKRTHTCVACMRPINLPTIICCRHVKILCSALHGQVFNVKMDMRQIIWTYADMHAKT